MAALGLVVATCGANDEPRLELRQPMLPNGADASGRTTEAHRGRRRHGPGRGTTAARTTTMRAGAWVGPLDQRHPRGSREEMARLPPRIKPIVSTSTRRPPRWSISRPSPPSRGEVRGLRSCVLDVSCDDLDFERRRLRPHDRVRRQEAPGVVEFPRVPRCAAKEGDATGSVTVRPRRPPTCADAVDFVQNLIDTYDSFATYRRPISSSSPASPRSSRRARRNESRSSGRRVRRLHRRVSVSTSPPVGQPASQFAAPPWPRRSGDRWWSRFDH